MIFHFINAIYILPNQQPHTLIFQIRSIFKAILKVTSRLVAKGVGLVFTIEKQLLMKIA